MHAAWLPATKRPSLGRRTEKSRHVVKSRESESLIDSSPNPGQQTQDSFCCDSEYRTPPCLAQEGGTKAGVHAPCMGHRTRTNSGQQVARKRLIATPHRWTLTKISTSELFFMAVAYSISRPCRHLLEQPESCRVREASAYYLLHVVCVALARRYIAVGDGPKYYCGIISRQFAAA